MQKGTNKPKVLYIATNIPTPKRKSNKVVMTIAHKLSESFDISVIHPREFAPFPFSRMKKYKNLADNKSWDDQGLQVVPLTYIRLFGEKLAFLLLPIFKKKIVKQANLEKPQLIHAHYVLPDGYFAYQIHQATHIPYIISFRTSDIKFLKLDKGNNSNKKFLTALSHASQIIVHNGAQKELLAKEGFESVIIPHGIEPSFIKEKDLLSRSKTITIATVSELIERKRIDWVINAIKDYQGAKDIVIKIAGDGPLQQKLESLANNNQRIQFLGRINHEEVGELLQESQIFVLPSYYETFGLVYLEATSHQNAVIATRDDGMWGLFKEEKEMFFCDSYDSFKKMLYELIDNDSLRNTIAKNAFDKTSAYFTWDKVIERYVKTYNDCLESN